MKTEEIIKIIEECFDNNIHGVYIQAEIGLKAKIVGKNKFLSELERKLRKRNQK